jgi:cellobiose phosphorylase
VKDSRAESVMIAGLFLYAGREMAELYDHMKRPADAERMRRARAEMLEAVEAAGWDGEWYRRAYDAFGKPVGSKECDEGKIFIESQGWCVLGGAGADDAPAASRGRARKAMESVDKLLYTPNGIVLQQPAYSTYRLELGEVSSYPPGVKENAGIFSHNNTWIHLGWCLLGDGDRALRYYLSICPSAKQDQIDTYRSEPYVYAQMTAGKDAPCFGEAKNSWLTGTAAWTLVALTQGILGVRPGYDALVVDPCVAREWKSFKVARRFRGAEYRIEVRNPKGVCKGVASVSVDGKAAAPRDGAAALPIFPEGSTHEIVITLG